MRGLLSQLSQLSAMPSSSCRFREGRLQPLHAAYRMTVISYLKQQLDDGVLRTTSLCEKVTTRIISEQEVRQIDPEGLSFINLNTPDEYQRALRRWRCDKFHQAIFPRIE